VAFVYTVDRTDCVLCTVSTVAMNPVGLCTTSVQEQDSVKNDNLMQFFFDTKVSYKSYALGG
jgi:hypothetical protein